jgi:YVTN family beta-propeller protein
MRGENAVKVLDGNADSTIAGVTVGDEPSALCINPIDNLAYCANSGDRSVSVIDVATHRVVATLRTLRYPSLLSFDSLNDKVYCAGQSWSVSVIYGPWNSVVATIPLAGLPTSLCLNQAENRTYVALYSGIGVAVLRDSMSSVEEGQTLEERRLSFQAWPTVCRGVLHLRMAAQTAGSRPSQVAVHDITGRLVNLKELPTGVPELELNLADLANGIYFVSPVIPGHTGPRIKIILNR